MSRNSQHAWLRAPGLQAAMREIPSSTSWKEASFEQQQAETRRLLGKEFAFIDNPDFREALSGERLFSEDLQLVRDEPIAKSARQGLPTHLERLCSAGLLTPEQETGLFERMNFLLHAASQCRSNLDSRKPSANKLDRIALLLALADWHRDRIIEANLRLVFSIVKKFVNPYVTFDDLLGDGMLALIRAVEKFDYARGFRFSTYATQVVRRNSYRLVVQKQADRSRMVDGLDELGLDEAEIPRESSISEQRWHQLRSRMAVLLDALDRREKLIIRARFSLGSHSKVQTLQAIAKRLGVSKERVRQIEKRALEKLQEMAGTTDLPDLESA
ncbi:MAG: sigma-70 family RNA polymerase sigma factor [Pirellulaceae bacterium]